ncbi:MAG: DUF5688 family protein [Lachnospiraceae bacterium]|nr:DUF5688 family protein [Lachnospiraceae bacterium]
MNAQDEKMMYRLFLSAVEKQVKLRMGQQHTVELGKAMKNNSVELDTIVIRGKDENIVPNIFLNAYYDEYIGGREIESIAEDVIKVYSENKDRFDMDSIGDCSFDFLKDRIFFKLVNLEMNRKLLENLPHIVIGDLVLIFACLVEHSSGGIASIRIDNSLMEKWNIDTGTLLKTAQENTVRLFPPKVFELENRNINLLLQHRLGDPDIKDLLEDDRDEEADEDVHRWIPDGIPALFVLTNRDGVDGATCIVYQGLLERIRRRLGRGFYIIPSSVHEVLILPENGAYNREELDNMVRDVNSSILSEMDILSQNVYYYPDDSFAV